MAVGLIRTPLACAILWLGIAGFANSALAAPRCVCRYAGKDYAEGQCVRMVNAAGERCGCCGRVLNNTSWTFSASACGIALGASTPRPNADPVPAMLVNDEITAILTLR